MEKDFGYAIIAGNPVMGFSIFLDEEGKPFGCETDAIEAAEREDVEKPWWVIPTNPIN